MISSDPSTPFKPPGNSNVELNTLTDSPGRSEAEKEKEKQWIFPKMDGLLHCATRSKMTRKRSEQEEERRTCRKSEKPRVDPVS